MANVDGGWYRNGTRFNPGSDTSQYILSTTTGELQIRNLTEATVGYYSCVTSVPDLGSYLTVDVAISLSIPSESGLTELCAGSLRMLLWEMSQCDQL